MKQCNIFIFLCFIFPFSLIAQTTSSITQFGITWTFDKPYEFGQFANGDYWVIGPVTIIDINPSCVTEVNNHIMNGSMVNPSPENGQGYDSECFGSTYVDSLNVGLNISTSNPLVLTSNTSLVTAISYSEVQRRPQLKTAAILTILSEAPVSGSFRPPYCGKDKTIRYNKNQLNYSLLKKLTPVDATPVLDTVERYFERPWLDHVAGWTAGAIHPEENLPNYGREISTLIGEGALMLHLNYSNNEKETLLIRYIQVGIDLYGILQNGGEDNWNGNGGHASGRKWPILFAGLILNDTGMKNIGQKSGDYFYSSGHNLENPISDYIHFGEDDQTFYVTQEDVDLTNSSLWEPDSRDVEVGHMLPYRSTNIGMPEWGITHTEIGYGDHDNMHWQAGYRECCTANAWLGFVLAAWIMNADANTIDLWNHPALFDYMDRYLAIENGDPDPFGYVVLGEDAVDWHRSWSDFTTNMWDTYRKNYDSIGITPFKATLLPFEPYPNPFRPYQGEKLVFTTLLENSQISLYNIHGDLVRKFQNEYSGIVEWDGRDSNGKFMVEGMYIFKVEDIRGSIGYGRIVLIR